MWGYGSRIAENKTFALPLEKTILSGVTRMLIRIVSIHKKNNPFTVGLSSNVVFYHHTAVCHLHVTSGLHAVPTLGDLVPLPGAGGLGHGGDTACSSRRCKAKPSWRHGLQLTDVWQDSEPCATLSSRHGSGNTAAPRVHLLEEQNVNNALTGADVSTFQH